MDKKTGVIVRDGKEFDCAESVLIIVNEGHPLPGFESNIMKAASPMGGGVGRWGSACGAATGAVMALGLVYGTDGEESLEVFQDRREHLFELGRVFMREFEEAFGSVNCSEIFYGLFPWTEESEVRYQEIKAQGLVKCDDYIDWAAKRVLEILGEG
ncbi:hypothetical protein ES703_05294 [subsurface metagenome]